ncbi:GNAT family N-acetyltransferase [Bacillus sp. FJAT-42315]|uniref:GNAT family N-acetyltransferase n=1 Tax=Bacillus sp. FJAT-42315 TaxID=2014077 RepID=UPI000C24E2EE|nr:GNAT family N-acetyltransferase [Bacillus sp. FJAT-42315]
MKIIVNQEEVQMNMKRLTFHSLLNRFREPDHQQATLRAALSEEVTMSLAIDCDTIIGYTVVLPPEKEERWSNLPFVRALGVVEVAPSFRGKGIAKQLVQTVTANPALESKIIISLEYYWHWDLQITKGDAYAYKQLLKNMLQASRFEDIQTNEPDIAGYPYNFMMGRIGKEITSEELYRFMKLADPDAFV